MSLHEHTMTLRRPLPRTPPAGADDAAVAALEAFDAGAALVDLTHQRFVWVSPGFSGRWSVGADDTLDRLEAALPGMTQSLVQLARPAAMLISSDAEVEAPRARWRFAHDRQPMLLEAVLVRPGVAALRLRGDSDAAQSAGDDERAVRRHLEDRERLLFTSRTLAVGEMASTLAHELNQPIGTVANVLRGLRLRLERQAANDELLGGVQLALEQALFAARIIARIREYTQSRQPRREPLDLAAVVRESLALLDWEIRRDGVALELALSNDACCVSGDEVMLQQLFVNLLRNALEAMRDNPPETSGPARRLALALAAERGMAVLTVRDNGCGLPKDAQDQLFVPFQSTKPNGMGIGLNICRSFVELHQGRLWFTPNDAPAERGCTFHVALPLVDASAGSPS